MENTCHILLAEDDESNQLLLEKMLSKEGNQVAVVGNGQQAIDELDKNYYDICILDMQMPVLSGIDALKLYKNTNPHGKASFIMLSADESENTVKQCLEAGADMYLIKPVTRPKLTEAIHLVLGEECASKADHEINNEKKSGCIDISRLKNINDQIFLDEFIRLFDDSADKLLNRLSLSLENEINVFKQTVHSLKGLSGNVDATRLRELTSLAENITSEDFKSSSKKHYQDISEELSKVRNELGKYSSKSS